MAGGREGHRESRSARFGNQRADITGESQVMFPAPDWKFQRDAGLLPVDILRHPVVLVLDLPLFNRR